MAGDCRACHLMFDSEYWFTYSVYQYQCERPNTVVFGIWFRNHIFRSIFRLKSSEFWQESDKAYCFFEPVPSWRFAYLVTAVWVGSCWSVRSAYNANQIRLLSSYRKAQIITVNHFIAFKRISRTATPVGQDRPISSIGEIGWHLLLRRGENYNFIEFRKNILW